MNDNKRDRLFSVYFLKCILTDRFWDKFSDRQELLLKKNAKNAIFESSIQAESLAFLQFCITFRAMEI